MILSLQRFSEEEYLQCKTYRAFSSAGSEHLPYKQRVGGSNPSTPTIHYQAVKKKFLAAFLFRFTFSLHFG